MSDEPTLAQLGEFAVIDRVLAGRRLHRHTVLGPGDDAAVLAAPDGRVVISTDMLVEGSHFRLDWSTPHDVGRKAIAQNAADIEAMGAAVTGFVAAVSAPAQTSAARLDELADGMWEEAARVGADVVGGDLVCGPCLVVSITATGDLAGRSAVTRAGATPGSAVAACGQLGRSAAGYALWDNTIDDFPDLRTRHLVPEPPYGQGALAAVAGATAMTDASDGLVADLRHVALASGVGVDLSAAALAPDAAAVAGAARVIGVDPLAWVLGGGEDHALLATFDGDVPTGWRVIGRVIGGPPRVLVDGGEWGGAAGWESFAPAEKSPAQSSGP